MNGFFQNLRDALAGLKSLPAMLEELRSARALLQQHVELVANYTEALLEIKKELHSIVSKLPFK